MGPAAFAATAATKHSVARPECLHVDVDMNSYPVPQGQPGAIGPAMAGGSRNAGARTIDNEEQTTRGRKRIIDEAKRPDVTKPHAVFLELCAGAAGLTGAVVRVGMPCDSPQDIFDKTYSGIQEEFDLLQPSHVRAIIKGIKRRKYRWVHGAPPCKTF